MYNNPPFAPSRVCDRLVPLIRTGDTLGRAARTDRPDSGRINGSSYVPGFWRISCRVLANVRSLGWLSLNCCFQTRRLAPRLLFFHKSREIFQKSYTQPDCRSRTKEIFEIGELYTVDQMLYHAYFKVVK